MRRVHLHKYRRAHGDAKADRVEAEADSVEGRYAWIDADKWEAITHGNRPEKPDSSKPGSSQVILANSPVNSSKIPNGSPQQDKKPSAARCSALDDHGPGSVLHLAIRRLTGQDVTAGCKCCRRIRLMNQRGWLWCVRNRTTILGWLREEGEKRGIAMDDATVRAAFAAAWREWRTLKQRTSDDT